MHLCLSKFSTIYGEPQVEVLNSESCHSLIGLLTPEYLRFLKLQVVPWFTGTGTCISPVPVNRNRGILTGSLLLLKRRSSRGLRCVIFARVHVR